MRHRRDHARPIRRHAEVCEFQLPRVEAFIPIHAITTLINDLITAILLFSLYSIERQRTLLVLAGGYLFTALIVIP